MDTNLSKIQQKLVDFMWEHDCSVHDDGWFGSEELRTKWLSINDGRWTTISTRWALEDKGILELTGDDYWLTHEYKLARALWNLYESAGQEFDHDSSVGLRDALLDAEKVLAIPERDSAV